MASVKIGQHSMTSQDDVGKSEEPVPESTDIMEWSDYGFRWLFNPYRFDHLPIEEQVLKYKHRNLLCSKVFKFGCRVFGEPRSRQRVMVVPPIGIKKQESQLILSQPATSSLKPYSAPNKNSLEEIQKNIKEFTDKEDTYHEWIKKRQKFRSDLDNMGLNEKWLSRKLDKTPIEQRVLQRFLREKYPRPPKQEPVIEEPLLAVLPAESPVICRPSPQAVQIIERFLAEKRMRLVDLFSDVDKDKDWLVSRDEFRKVIKKAKIPLSNDLLEDLIITLDTDLDEKLDYRELAKGMGLWKVEKRESKRKRAGKSPGRTSAHSTQTQVISPSIPEGTPSRTHSPLREASWAENNRYSPSQRVKSALSTISSGSSQYLEPPDLDTRPEQRMDTPEAMVDLRKRNRESLSRITGHKGKPIKKKKGTTYATNSMLKTGDPAVDHHMQPSTLGGETGEQVDQFRQTRLQEYHLVCQMCKENNIPLGEALLEKVLLFPPDRSHTQMKRSLRKSGGTQWSNTVPSATHKSSTKNGKSKRDLSPIHHTPGITSTSHRKKVVYDKKSSYPTKKSVSSAPTKVNLSTGRAVISRNVDCWMSFEEYDQLTRHLGSKYTALHGRSDDNAFWPGQLLDKLRLCMPNTEPKYNSVFQTIKAEKKSNPGYNNDLRTWPVGDEGFIQYGLVDPYKNKFIHS